MTLRCSFTFHLHTAADPFAEGDAQAGAGDVEDGAVDRLAGSRKDFDFGGILGAVTGFRAPF